MLAIQRTHGIKMSRRDVGAKPIFFFFIFVKHKDVLLKVIYLKLASHVHMQ